MPSFQLPKAVRRVADSAASAGGHAYVVGGSVRDHLLGRTHHDWDLEVFGLTAEELEVVLRRLGKVNAVGRAFGVFKIRAGRHEIDVSIPRRDSKVGPGHKGIAVSGDPDMPPREAARRRDLTVNAIMYDTVTNEIFDPFHGVGDLKDGLLRPVDETTFLEDPLRALRAIQFAARLGFRATDDLCGLCRAASLGELPAERIQGEWKKLLLQGTHIAHGLALARATDVHQRCFPEAGETSSHDAALDRLAAGPRQALTADGPKWTVMLAVWLHGRPIAAVEATLDRLWLHRVDGYDVRARTVAAITHRAHGFETDADLRWLSTRSHPAVHLRMAHAVSPEAGADLALTRAQELGIDHEPPTPLLRGRDLLSHGHAPGPALGQILERVYAQQLDGAVETLEDALAAAKPSPS